MAVIKCNCERRAATRKTHNFIWLQTEFMSIEIERKYIIRIPDIEKMRVMSDYSESEIVQIYLSSGPGVTHRIRSRKTDGKTVYTETKKIRIDSVSAYEDEREINGAEFERLSLKAKEGSIPIRKVRHKFCYRQQSFEVDIYPEWKKSCILETELESRDKIADFPEFIKILAEVSGNKEYSNAAMSQKFPKESV